MAGVPVSHKIPIRGMALGAVANVGYEMIWAAPGEKAPAIAGAAAMGAAGLGVSRIGLSGLKGGLIGFGVEMAAYYAVKHGLLSLEEATKKSNERFRSATRVGFAVSDTFGNESRSLLTQRQASLRTIQTSVLNARSSIGNEAAMVRKQIDEYL